MTRFMFSMLFTVLAGVPHANGQSTSWSSLQTLTAGAQGTNLLILHVPVTNQFVPSVRCRLLSVAQQELTCAEEGVQAQPLVVHAEDVAQIDVILRKKERFRYGKGVLGAALGFGVGALITDGSANLPLAGIGAVAGALYGLTKAGEPVRESYTCVYRRAFIEVALPPDGDSPAPGEAPEQPAAVAAPIF